MRLISLLIVVASVPLLLTGCVPDHGPLSSQNVMATPRETAGICSPTADQYDGGYLGYDLVNKTDHLLTITDIQPRNRTNLDIYTTYFLGPKTDQVGYLNQPNLVADELPGWRTLNNTRLPAHTTYQFLVRFTLTDPKKYAHLRDFVVTYKAGSTEYQAATGFGYTLTQQRGC